MARPRTLMTTRRARVIRAEDMSQEMNNSQDEKKVVKKVRILQRDDGAVFTWTSVLETRNDMRGGYLYKYADGTTSITLDKASTKTMDAVNVGKREQSLIDENAKLKAELEALKGNTASSVSVMEPAAENTIILDQGESAIPTE